MMTARENLLEILQFGAPERVVSTFPSYEIGYLGGKRQGYGDGAAPVRAVGERWTDVWGIGYEKAQPDVPAYPCEHPIPTPGDLKDYEWLDADDERICGRIYEEYEGFSGGDVFLSGGLPNLLWERAYKLVGMQNLMEYFYTEPNFVKDVFRRITEFHLGIAEHYLKLGVESIGSSDDLGMQSGAMFSPQIMQEFFMPEYRRIIGTFRSRGVLFGLHSCGNVSAFLDDFIDLGITSLHPVQVTANDLDHVRSVTQGRLALHGGISNITVTNGPVEAIEAEVRTRLWQLGRSGGYICGVDQSMPASAEHWQALRDAVEEYGRYPLSPPPGWDGDDAEGA
jgi:uroporphyrinogen decarboxylase